MYHFRPFVWGRLISEWLYSEGVYNGFHYDLTLPNLDSLLLDVMNKGHPMIFKIDIAKAFRHVSIDLGDAVKLSIYHEG